jgi:hypothetical protein
MDAMTVSLAPAQVASLVYESVTSRGITAECVANHVVQAQDGHGVAFLVFEKYYVRNSSRASLSVVAEDLGGVTRVVAHGSGGGASALFKFDWGANRNFEGQVRDTLAPYLVQDPYQGAPRPA